VIERADFGRGEITHLPQHAEIEIRFPISVIDTALLGHWRQIGWAGASTEAMRQAACKALAAVGLDGFERRPIETLSAGQFQRALFTRLIVQDAELILLDEPSPPAGQRRPPSPGRELAPGTPDGRGGATRPRPGRGAFPRHLTDRTGMRRLARNAGGGDGAQSGAGAICPKPGRPRPRIAGVSRDPEKFFPRQNDSVRWNRSA
jgi:hypothetical protein